MGRFHIDLYFCLLKEKVIIVMFLVCPMDNNQPVVMSS